MKKIKIKIPKWTIIIATLILAVGLTSTFVKASGRFNLPLSWILTPSGTSIDTNNDGLVDIDRLPSGMITMFDTDCPSGWTRLTALDGKFLVASSTYNTAAGGSNTQTHGAGNLEADSAGAHTHTVSGTAASVGNHSHTVNSHTHSGGSLAFSSGLIGTATGSYGSWRVNHTTSPGTWKYAPGQWWGATGGTAPGTNSQGAHDHSVSGTAAEDGPHTHTISGLTGSADNRPEYATIIICKKD